VLPLPPFQFSRALANNLLHRHLYPFLIRYRSRSLSRPLAISSPFLLPLEVGLRLQIHVEMG
jgi:hypothetical protein